ncbi:conjugal transfer protein TraI [Mucilaginibacter paludis]|nr:conjugal transfer protein TraI [Mucilaginibacter paludis]
MNAIKKYMVILPLSAITLFVALPKEANAQIAIAEVIKAAITKVIKAIDLQIQRLQNQTIWLQNAQKTLENTLSKTKLGEISDWTQQQKDLFSKYYQELQEIKSVIAMYERIKEMTEKQAAVVNSYHHAWALLQQDKHFSPDELNYMAKVYKGILEESVKNVDELLLVVSSFKTQMTDEKRLELINASANRIDTNYSDLRQFNAQNALLSLQRAKDENEVITLKKYYGIQ